jgi:hypothetical protein
VTFAVVGPNATHSNGVTHLDERTSPIATLGTRDDVTRRRLTIACSVCFDQIDVNSMKFYWTLTLLSASIKRIKWNNELFPRGISSTCESRSICWSHSMSLTQRIGHSLVNTSTASLVEHLACQSAELAEHDTHVACRAVVHR